MHYRLGTVSELVCVCFGDWTFPPTQQIRTVTPLGLTIYGLAITFMGRQKQKNRWIPGAGIELTAIAMSIPVSYQLRYQIDFEISAG